MQALAHPEVVEVGQVAQGNASAVVSFSAIHQRLGITAIDICVPKATVQHNLQITLPVVSVAEAEQQLAKSETSCTSKEA